MYISQVIQFLENIAPLPLQEAYDNSGLIIGHEGAICTGILISLDCVEAVVDEAIQKNCNLIVSHHPIIFKGLKKITANTYVERTIIKAIKNDIAIYAIHTNIDNIKTGVSGKMATLLGLVQQQVLAPKKDLLRKLTVLTPTDNAAVLAKALYAAGAGNIGNYTECSFSTNGVGTFTPTMGAKPYVGVVGSAEQVIETKLEVIFPHWLQSKVLAAMKANHPYEEIAYNVVLINNEHLQIGSGIIGELPMALPTQLFLTHVAKVFNLKLIKHTNFSGNKIKKIALCGGTGSFLINPAIAAGADAFITADLKYHEYFDADAKLLLADIGHFESEQYTIDLLFELLSDNFPNFALHKTSVNTNPVGYFTL